MPVIRKGGTDMEGTNNETKTNTDAKENTVPLQPDEAQTDPGAEIQDEAKKDPGKKKIRKKIIIAVSIVVVCLLISLITFIPGGRGGIVFDEKTAVSFDVYGLTCYAPEGWVVEESGAVYYPEGSTENDDILAALSVEYLGEYDSFEDVLKENEDCYAEEYASKTKIANCKGATILDYEDLLIDGLYAYAYIVLCDRSAFWIVGLAQEEYFDAEEFDKMILAADYEDYTSATICEYLGGHDLPEDAEWEVTRESTCTKEGEEATECPVCLQTVTREIPMIDHKIEDGKVVESTCVEKGTVTGICSICEEEVTEELPLAEHTYGDWIVTKEATESSAGTRHKECTVCGAKTGDESFTLSLEEIKDSYNTGITYNQLARTPDDYEGKKVKFKGRVLQVVEGSYGVTSLRVATKGRYDNVIYVTYLSSIVESRVLEDDTVTIYGTSKGLYSYESTGAGTITIPAVSADYID